MENTTLKFLEEFTSSTSEMNRRKRAFLSLATSLFISISVSFLTFFFSYAHLILPFLAVLALILVFTVVYFNRLLDRSKSITITISDQKIEKKWFNKIDIYESKSISDIRIKRTTANLIREIKIVMSGVRPFYVNGLDGFEVFNNRLLSIVGNDVKIHKIKEPIDFDHPLFYILLGTSVGIVSVFFLKILFIYSAISINNSLFHHSCRYLLAFQ
jgi:hypothetical protein